MQKCRSIKKWMLNFLFLWMACGINCDTLLHIHITHISLIFNLIHIHTHLWALHKDCQVCETLALVQKTQWSTLHVYYVVVFWNETAKYCTLSGYFYFIHVPVPFDANIFSVLQACRSEEKATTNNILAIYLFVLWIIHKFVSVHPFHTTVCQCTLQWEKDPDQFKFVFDFGQCKNY